MDTSKEILFQFIENETSALSRNEQGSFWPQNHHRITPLINRAHKVLDEKKLCDFYFHLLRLNQCPSLKSEFELRALCSAYLRVLPLFDFGYPNCQLSRIKGLFIFGFNDLDELPSEPKFTLDLFKEYLGLLHYIDSFSHIPGMLKKRSKFIEYSENKMLVIRAQKTLTYIDYEMRGPFLLWLWGLIFLTLQLNDTGMKVVRKLKDLELSPKEYVSMLEILRRFVEASKRNDLMKFLDEGDQGGTH